MSVMRSSNAKCEKLAAIDFFGYLPSDDLAAIRRALPFREGALLDLESFAVTRPRQRRS